MSETTRKHLRQYQMLIELEEAEDHAAIIALTKVWGYEHLNAHPNRLARMQAHIQKFQEDLMDSAFDNFVSSRPQWPLMDTEGLANNFAISHESPASPYKEIFEYVQARQRSHRYQMLELQMETLMRIGPESWSKAQQGSSKHAVILYKQLLLNLPGWVEAGFAMEITKHLRTALGDPIADWTVGDKIE